jgi:hypothetical protein
LCPVARHEEVAWLGVVRLPLVPWNNPEMESGATVFNNAQERGRRDCAQQDLIFLNHRGGNSIAKTVSQPSTK